MTHADASSPQPAWGALRHRGFALFWVSRFCTTFATQIVSVAVGWQIYDLTRDPFDLGLVGLVQFAPSLLLVLVTGAVSDRFNRRMIVAICQFIEAICAGLLLYLVWTGDVTVPAIFATLVAFGVARAFMNPASQSLIPNLVPAEALASAIALSSSSWQIAVILGPVAGGLLYGLGADIAYFAAVAIFIAAAILIALVPRPPQKTVPEPANWTTVIAGFRYVWHEKIVLGAISLDLFAVLLGGAVALLPAYARDVLDVGPWGLGLLRSAPGIGAIVVALVLAVRPIRDHAGLIMFACVALFGAFTLTFGLSTLVWLSVAALALAGAADMVSVYIRETLIQLWTPDAVRGRVNAVNMVFIGASNELGEFRAGSVAALIGLVPAVVIGGIGTIAVAGLWMFMFPALRKARHLSGRV
ncbi:MAG: MFS transporter [Bauldia sp.]|uniref:MFS transporter n=1 Tax=Bauldia sp. TaxID=2575872 RepID=UPI001DD3CA34|nr:MFS transporter [Bauldia sp.]MCB1495981.1 MFS transporter [Bauldia sp.]